MADTSLGGNSAHVIRFDPADWLARFEAAGGNAWVDGRNGRLQIGWSLDVATDQGLGACCASSGGSRPHDDRGGNLMGAHTQLPPEPAIPALGHNFPPETIAFPAGDLRVLADMLTTMQQVCAKAAAVLIDRLDEHDLPTSDDEPDFTSRADGLPGDPADTEPDPESSGDPAWIEWHTRGRTKLGNGGELLARHAHGGAAQEDDEDDDPAEADDPAEEDDHSGVNDEDGCNTLTEREYMGLPLDAGAGDPDDAEHWAMTDNVPMPKVMSAEHNIFTDQRVLLGRTNLQTSFRTNGSDVRSADTGRILRTKAEHRRPEPGKPA